MARRLVPLQDYKTDAGDSCVCLLGMVLLTIYRSRLEYTFHLAKQTTGGAGYVHSMLHCRARLPPIALTGDKDTGHLSSESRQKYGPVALDDILVPSLVLYNIKRPIPIEDLRAAVASLLTDGNKPQEVTWKCINYAPLSKVFLDLGRELRIVVCF
ncbi:hypothetical protein BDN72DRAFT_91572 [Pluteus cervinus]|uniref:Uncharacterized protein n=1 Tax=Pluteus cervinus TaxID=181527 RepID=A0ACD3ANU0_9AGAR|nr:hypothetical protein BDN72DRAFT_91572 [Pluteus cervinus]